MTNEMSSEKVGRNDEVAEFGADRMAEMEGSDGGELDERNFEARTVTWKGIVYLATIQECEKK